MRIREYGAEVDGRLVMELALSFEDDVIGVTSGILLEGILVKSILSSTANGRVAPRLERASICGFESSAIVMSKPPIEGERFKKSQAGMSNCPFKSAKSICGEFELRLEG